MTAPSVAQQLGQFTANTSFPALPASVVLESKRILLDSVGCAVAASAASANNIKASAALQFARQMGGVDRSATVFGSADRSSLYGAAFANGELINALDFDAVLPPGHVSPYVLPGAIAVAETDRASGPDLVAAIAVAHEMSTRFGRTMDYIRDTRAGRVSWAPVLGYSSTVFGATAAICRLRRLSGEVTAHALSIAASTSPVNALRSWVEHAPAATTKYTMAGSIAHTALNAASMAAAGHRGDRGVLEDAEYGYPRFIGTTRWEPLALTKDLGQVWSFHRQNAFKHYPHCRALHGLLDLLDDCLADNAITSDEITAIKAWGEGHTERPVWTTTDVDDPIAGQMSIAHGLAVGAQRIPPGRAWQEPAVMHHPEVIRLMHHVSYDTHPDWVDAIADDPTARPSRIEVYARGEVFTAELRHPRGTPDPELGQSMTDDELLAKYAVNTVETLGQSASDEAADAIMRLEALADVAPTIFLLGTAG